MSFKLRIKPASKYCIERKCKGYQTASTRLFPLIKDLRTINRRLEDSEKNKKILTGEEKSYCKILTKMEETSLVNYLLNRNRCRKAVSEKQTEGLVLNILRTRFFKD